MTQITKNFNLSEFFSDEDLMKNNYTPEDLINVVYLCTEVLQPLRNALNKPIIITSGFRTVAHNEEVNGAINSQHCKGQAADFKCNNMKNAFETIKDGLIFDQLIWEGGSHFSPAWIHVSFNRKKNRQETIKAI